MKQQRAKEISGVEIAGERETFSKSEIGAVSEEGRQSVSEKLQRENQENAESRIRVKRPAGDAYFFSFKAVLIVSTSRFMSKGLKSVSARVRLMKSAILGSLWCPVMKMKRRASFGFNRCTPM